MASRFHDLDRLAQDAASAVMSEAVLISPWVHSDYAGQADSTRPARLIQGTVLIAAEKLTFKGALRGDENVSGTEFGSSPSVIWISATEAAKIGYTLRRHDRITIASGQVFTVTRAIRSEYGELTVHVTAEA